MIDIDALLAPISEASPCGDDLLLSPEFDAIQEARRSDDATLDQGEWVTDLKTADWATVAKSCGELLTTRSKDLRLAVWLAEAAAHQNGFAGLADGYRAVAGLCERYWDDIHPAAEDGDAELRIGNLTWLLTQSIQWVRTIPLTDAPQGRYDAIAVEMAARGHQGDDSDGNRYPDAATLAAARASTPFDFYRQLSEDVPAAREALRQLETVIDAQLGQDGPSFAAIRDTLASVGDTALRMAAAAGVVLSAGDLPTAEGETATAQPSASSGATIGGEITSRKQALQELRRVADYFRRTEPHSPVAYLAEKAARWGDMPLHVWLKRVLKDNPALGQLEDMLDVGVADGEHGNP